MSKMKAFIRVDGLSQEVKLDEVPLPQVQSDEVLIKVEAFGVGIHDRYFIPMNARFPYIIGSEAAGVITQLGSQVENFAIGDRVVFTTILQAQGGCWAEYAVAKKAVIIPLPDNLTFAQGAAIPIAGKTALECMREIDLKKDDTLFIAGASGAVGTMVIQLAVLQGIRVSASASEKNQDYMLSLGLEKAVDYNDPDWKDKVTEWSKGGVTAALAIQPGTGSDSIKVVKDGGKLITVSGDNHSVAPERNVSIAQMGHKLDAQQKVLDLIKAISNKEVKLVIEKEYSFEQALEALGKTETRHARGKQVVKGFN